MFFRSSVFSQKNGFLWKGKTCVRKMLFPKKRRVERVADCARTDAGKKMSAPRGEKSVGMGCVWIAFACLTVLISKHEIVL